MPIPIGKFQEDGDIEMLDLTRDSLLPKNERENPISSIDGFTGLTFGVQANEGEEVSGAQERTLVNTREALHPISIKATKAVQTRAMVDIGIQVDIEERESVTSPLAIQRPVLSSLKASLLPVQHLTIPATPTPPPKPWADRSSLLFAQPSTVPHMRHESPPTIFPARSIEQHAPEHINRTIVHVGHSSMSWNRC